MVLHPRGATEREKSPKVAVAAAAAVVSGVFASGGPDLSKISTGDLSTPLKVSPLSDELAVRTLQGTDQNGSNAKATHTNTLYSNALRLTSFHWSAG